MSLPYVYFSLSKWPYSSSSSELLLVLRNQLNRSPLWHLASSFFITWSICCSTNLSHPVPSAFCIIIQIILCSICVCLPIYLEVSANFLFGFPFPVPNRMSHNLQSISAFWMNKWMNHIFSEKWRVSCGHLPVLLGGGAAMFLQLVKIVGSRFQKHFAKSLIY